MTLPRYFAVGLVLSIVPSAFGIDPKVAVPPVAAVKPHSVKLHGDMRVDPYFWLAEKKNPEVIAHLEAENAYMTAVMKPLEAKQEQLYKEMLARIKQTDLTVPTRDRGYWYYTRTVEGQQYPIHCRRKGAMDAAEEVYLNANELAKPHKFFSVGQTQVSDDGKLLAFGSDVTGFREYFLSVKDLSTGKVLEDRFVKVAGTAWAADNKTLFYVTEDHAKRPHKLWRHTLGEPKEKDRLVYEEKDELYRLGVGRSHDRKYLLRTSRSSTTTEEWYLPADAPGGEWKVILPREVGHEYSADHRDGLFYIRTNKGGSTNFKLVTCPVGDTDPKGWKEFLPYNPAIHVQDIELFRNYAVVSEREAGLPQLRVVDLRDGKQHRIEFPEAVYSANLGGNPEYEMDAVRMSYTSMVTPASVYEYDLATKGRKLLKQVEVPGGFKSEDYVTERVFATAADGTKVPISLVYKKGVKRDGTAPCLLTGYGSYGASIPVGFSPTRLPLLDRGVVFAQAHIRGGSDMGRPWYDAGKMMNKKNTFTDFIACADHLVHEKYCSRDRLAIQGGSAGGLLVGATINLRPDVCKAAVLQVPFVDVVNTMLDANLPLTVQEYLEWGNPNETSAYEYMKSYCPYTNLKKGAYPSILVTTSLNDSQVMYHEPAKYVAKLRTLKTDSNPLLFKCQMAGGHGGPSGRYDNLKEQAFVTAFVLDQIGVKE